MNIYEKHSLKEFNALRVSKIESDMWRAYYSHNFARLYHLLVKLFKEQFNVNIFTAVRMSYFSGHAAVVFRKSGERDTVVRYLSYFYRTIKNNSLEEFDERLAANLEFEWWLKHRFNRDQKNDLVMAVSNSMAILYGIEPRNLREYATSRCKAMEIRDNSLRTENRTPDWNAIQSYLEKSYQSLHYIVNK